MFGDGSLAVVCLFDETRLQLGDVALERGRGIGSAVVATATLGRFSHALIWVGSDFVEAMPSGTRNLSYARVPIQVRKNWCLLRPLSTFPGIGEKAAIQARGLVHKDYDLEGALRTVVAPRPSAQPSAIFCSQLVAEAYRRAGLELIPGKTPEQINPNMLRKSKRLREVPLPLRLAEDILGKPYPPEWLDRNAGYIGSPMEAEADISKAAFRAVEGFLVGWPGSLPRPGNLVDLISFLPHVTSLAREMIADRLLVELEERQYFDLLVPALSHFYFEVGPTDRWRRQMQGWLETRDRFRFNAHTCAAICELWPHPLYERLKLMHTMNAFGIEALIAKVRGEG